MAAERDDNGVTVCTPARRDRRTRRACPARHVPLAGPVAVLGLLALTATAGCSAQADGGGGPGGAAGSHGSAGTHGVAAGRSPAASGGSASPGGSGSAAGGPGGSGGSGPGGSGPGGSGPGGSGPGGAGGGAACASWPAGSTRTTLLITAGSDGRTYCVRTGQTVDVVLSGTLSLADGSQMPRLTGNALAAGRQAQVTRMSAESYTAVRPGTSVLTVVRLPCHKLQPMQSTQASPAADAPAGSVPAAAIDMAYWSRSSAGSAGSAAAGRSAAAGAGGAPIGTNCASQRVLRITIVVTA